MPVFSPLKANLLLLSLVFYALLCGFLALYLPHYFIAPQLPPAIAPNFSEIQDTTERKQAFFDFLDPLVMEQNAKILRQRDELTSLQVRFDQEKHLTPRYKMRLTRLAKLYRLDVDELTTKEQLAELHLRIDQIPASMVLAQAANESAWGTSRFAQEGNNYFGQWCFRKGCGLVPDRRGEGKDHEVAKFNSARQSVTSYFLNINTHRAYREIRKLRAELRESNQPVTSAKLLQGLSRYSERGQEYIEELEQMIRFNALAPKDKRINPPATE